MSLQKADWMEKLSHYQLKIEYKPSRKLVTSDVFSRPYIESITGIDDLNPKWAMLHLRDQVIHYEELTPTTINRLNMDEDKFAIDGGNICSILKDGLRVP